MCSEPTSSASCVVASSCLLSPGVGAPGIDGARHLLSICLVATLSVCLQSQSKASQRLFCSLSARVRRWQPAAVPEQRAAGLRTHTQIEGRRFSLKAALRRHAASCRRRWRQRQSWCRQQEGSLFCRALQCSHLPAATQASLELQEPLSHRFVPSLLNYRPLPCSVLLMLSYCQHTKLADLLKSATCRHNAARLAAPAAPLRGVH